MMIPPELHTSKTETQKPILGEHYSHITKYITTFTIWKWQYYFLSLKAKNQSTLVGNNTVLDKCYSYQLCQGVILK